MYLLLLDQVLGFSNSTGTGHSCWGPCMAAKGTFISKRECILESCMGPAVRWVIQYTFKKQFSFVENQVSLNYDTLLSALLVVH